MYLGFDDDEEIHWDDIPSVPKGADQPTAVIYARCLPDDQSADLTTLIKRCKLSCELEGYILLRIFTDEDCTSQTRRILKSALEYCSGNNVNYLVVPALVHLSQYPKQLLKILNKLIDLDITVNTVSPDESTPFSNSFNSLLDLTKNVLSIENRDKIKNGMEDARKGGKIVHRLPVGLIRIKPQARTIHDEAIAPLIRMLFECYAKGQYTLREVTAFIARQGLTNPRTGKPFGLSSIKRILSNPIYCGLIRTSNRAITVRADFEPIVDERTFKFVQYRLFSDSLHPRRRGSLPTKSNPV